MSQIPILNSLIVFFFFIIHVLLLRFYLVYFVLVLSSASPATGLLPTECTCSVFSSWLFFSVYTLLFLCEALSSISIIKCKPCFLDPCFLFWPLIIVHPYWILSACWCPSWKRIMIRPNKVHVDFFHIASSLHSTRYNSDGCSWCWNVTINNFVTIMKSLLLSLEAWSLITVIKILHAHTHNLNFDGTVFILITYNFTFKGILKNQWSRK